MEEYILKSALIAEIEKLLNDEFQCSSYDEATGFQKDLNLIKSFINTLEVKEVELDKELSTYLEVVKATDEDIDFVDFAKHFFELGIKAQKA